jgi:osmotically-inducible protein OsmY
MNSTALLKAGLAGLGLSLLLLAAGCQDSAVQVQRDAQGNEQIHVNNQVIHDNLHQAGQELKQGAHQLGDAIRSGAHDLDTKVGPSTRESVADAALTTKVKARLIAAPDLGGIRVHVNSRDGQVTLSGTVSSERNRQEAERIARRTSGVQGVVNDLAVGPVG